MKFTEKYNHKVNVFTYDTRDKDFKYYKLQDAFEKNGENAIYRLRGLFKTEGKFGVRAVAVCDDCYLNLPSGADDLVSKILNDEEAIDEINNCRVGFRIYKYHSTRFNKDCFDIEFVEIDSQQS